MKKCITCGQMNLDDVDVCGCGRKLANKLIVECQSNTTTQDILKKHGVWTHDLEVELLRHFDKLRLEMLNTGKKP